MKLFRFVSIVTGLSRRKSIELIKNESVGVNKIPALEFNLFVDPNKDSVEIQGLVYSKDNMREALHPKYYIAYYKPRGIEVSLKKGSHTIHRVVEEIGIMDLKPVGRLDLDSEGLLLLSNDGDFIHRLTHPSYHVPKVYRVWISGLKEQDMEQMEFLRSVFILRNIESDMRDKRRKILEIELA